MEWADHTDALFGDGGRSKENGGTVKPVCNDQLYNKMYYLWFIQ